MKRYRTPNKIQIGIRSGKLTVIEDLGLIEDNSGKNRRYCKCQCDCGAEKIIRYDQIASISTLSCGCLFRDFLFSGNARRKHGESKTKLYQAWIGMFIRTNKNDTQQKRSNYRKLGISVCREWNDYLIFKRDMYTSYQNHVTKHGVKETTLDRIDTYGNYEPSNCRWATYKEQANNTTKQYGNNK